VMIIARQLRDEEHTDSTGVNRANLNQPDTNRLAFNSLN
jgi:hypothetical protein